MKKVGDHNSISRKLFFSLALMLSLSFSLFAQDAAAPAGGGDPAAGKALFNANCAACHKLDAKMTGPALRGVAGRHDMAWIYKWVHNSSAMIKSGDAAAVKLSTEYNGAVMTPFPQLSEGDIDNIIAYTSEPKTEAPKVAAGSAAPPGTEANTSGISNNVMLGALSFIMLILIVMLVMVNKVLTKVAKANGIEIEAREQRVPIWKAFARNQFLVFVTSVFLLLASGYFVYGYLMQIGVDQNYEPIQPIHYSHRIHAGSNGIDCKYCHSSARVSKNAGIPSLNVCMNCHKTISEFQGDKDSTYVEYTKEYYTAEIQKLYDAVGWDKTNQTYTGKTKPVKWVRIHNLPDFVYF